MLTVPTAAIRTENGKTVDMKPTRASTIWVRNGEKWQAAWHEETPMAAVAPAADDKKAEAKPAEPKKDVVAKEEPKKEEPKKEAKKEEPKKDEKKK